VWPLGGQDAAVRRGQDAAPGGQDATTRGQDAAAANPSRPPYKRAGSAVYSVLEKVIFDLTWWQV